MSLRSYELRVLSQPEKPPDLTQHLLRLVVLEPVSGAGDGLDARLREIALKACSLGAGQKAFAGIQQQRWARDARPQRDVIVRPQTVRRASALVGIELPAIAAV